MPVTQIADVIVPVEFTQYQVENSLLSTALFLSGVVAKNGLIAAQLQAGAESFNVPFWADLGESEADITSDDPTVLSTPLKITASKQVVRKSFLHQSWSEMSLASELSGDDALERVQSRVSAYWDRQFEKRLIASLQGVLASNVANNGGDMVNDISGAAGTAANFAGAAVIDTALTLGDRLGDAKAIAMHSYAVGFLTVTSKMGSCLRFAASRLRPDGRSAGNRALYSRSASTCLWRRFFRRRPRGQA
jgi:hypothetical protein